MPQPAIVVEQLGKEYRLGAKVESYRTLRDAIASGVSAPFRRLLNPVERRAEEDGRKFWALRKVSFEVQPGEAVAIIGCNGAGKSTLLKILSRITDPTKGYAEIRGSVGSLLEVGTGFHPELTGRENVFLNGAILGMGKTEITRKMDEIVSFAEVGKFMDTAVKHYSSGMHLRLAFAVAAHLEPDILLMDEVLAVGDAVFQKKCLGRMGAVAGDGRTVLFVSHNMGAIRELCTRAIWIDGGEVRLDGDVADVTAAYLRTIAGGAFTYKNKEAEFAIEAVILRSDSDAASRQFAPGDDLIVEVHYLAARPVRQPHFVLVVEGLFGRCFSANMQLDGHTPSELEGSGVLRCRFRELPLLPQSYSVKLMVKHADGVQQLVPLQDAASFDVVGRLEEYGMKGRFHSRAGKSVSVMIPYEWILPGGRVERVELKKPPVAAR